MERETNFEIFRVNKQLCKFSYDGRFLAIANHDKINVKNTGTFDMFLEFFFIGIIEDLEWSPNSEYILCFNSKKVTIQIYCINYPEWKFKLKEGSCGLLSAIWLPDSKSIISISDFKEQLSIWSLADHSVRYIKNLKSSAVRGMECSPNGKCLAVIIRNCEKDCIQIYKTKTWKLTRKLICDGLFCIDGLSWSPSSELLSIWCSVSGHAKLIIYSNKTENYEGIFLPDDYNGEKFKNQQLIGKSVEKLRGLEIIRWMPSGQLLAVAGHNETIVFLNCLTWKPILQLRLDPVIKGHFYLARIFKECIIKTSTTNSKFYESNQSSERHILEEICGRPFNIPIIKQDLLIGSDLSTTNIHVIDILEFSNCGQYLAVRHQIYPCALWIWDIRTNGCDIIVLENHISKIKWDPSEARLLAFTENPYIYEWSPKEVSCLPSPKGMNVINIQWHPSSKLAVLCGFNRGQLHKFKGN